MTTTKIIVASNNQGKIKEFKKIFEKSGIEVLSLQDINVEIEIEETGQTFEENAYIKAKTIYDKIGLPVIADDSGLMVDYLDGLPGVMSARFAGPLATDKDRINKILTEMKDADSSQRGAKFVCSIVFIAPGEDGAETVIKASGECLGEIAFEPRGEEGFGYDPIFLVGDKTFAQMSKAEKNEISHRGKALEDLKSKLVNFI